VAKTSPNLPAWIAKGVGGSTMHRAGISLRFNPCEFKPRSTYGAVPPQLHVSKKSTLAIDDATAGQRHDYEQTAVDLRKEEHLGEAFRSINPQQLVPALEVEREVIVQSPAIIAWLEERYPHPSPLPRIRASAQRFVQWPP
jgi:Glutathione S-transferase, N-terminal domain